MKVGRADGGPSESNLKELENVTGATVDTIDYREQTAGCLFLTGAPLKITIFLVSKF